MIFPPDEFEKYNLTEMVGSDSDLLTKNKNMNIKYSLTKGIGKGVLNFVIFALPLLLANYPAWANLTLGGLGVILVNYLKIKYKNA